MTDSPGNDHIQGMQAELLQAKLLNATREQLDGALVDITDALESMSETQTQGRMEISRLDERTKSFRRELTKAQADISRIREEIILLHGEVAKAVAAYQEAVRVTAGQALESAKTPSQVNITVDEKKPGWLTAALGALWKIIRGGL